MSNAPISSPATAGPRIRDALNRAELSPTAFATSSRPTISTANAWRVGMSIALVMPRSAARTMTCQTSTTPVAVSANRTKARTIATVWVAISVLRLGSWSAITPPNRPKMITGPNWATDDQAEPERVVGQLEDEPALGDLLHPRPDQRDQPGRRRRGGSCGGGRRGRRGT